MTLGGWGLLAGGLVLVGGWGLLGHGLAAEERRLRDAYDAHVVRQREEARRPRWVACWPIGRATHTPIVEEWATDIVWEVASRTLRWQAEESGEARICHFCSCLVGRR